MTLPVSGAISFADINLEIYGSSSTTQVSLGDSIVRTIFQDTDGAIDMNTGHGKAYTIPGNSGVLTSGSSYTLPRTSGKTINVIAIAGGGGGGGGSGRTSFSGYYIGGGGGGSGGNAYATNITVTPGQSVSFSIGGGGSGGIPRDGIYGDQGNVGSNGSSGGGTSLSVNGTTYAFATSGSGGVKTPGGNAGGAGSYSAGSQLISATDGIAGVSDTKGGAGARGYTINTTVGTAVGSILDYGSYGVGYPEGSGGYSTTGSGYGAGGTGGGDAQSDRVNYNNIFSAPGAAGAVFIWWGY